MTRWLKPWELTGGDTRPERPALRESLRAFHTAIRGRPPADLPVTSSTFPGRKAVAIPGQLDVEHDGEARGP